MTTVHKGKEGLENCSQVVGGRDNSSQGPGGLGELFIGARRT